MQNIAMKGKIGEDKIEVKISKNNSKNTIIYLLIKKPYFKNYMVFLYFIQLNLYICNYLLKTISLLLASVKYFINS